MAAAVAIFAFTYLAVAAGRLPPLSVDRPAAALLGAALMVAAGVLSPSQASAAVNGDTLGLLLGTMILSAYLMAIGGRAPREALAKVDWPLLVFFAGLFVVVAGVARTGVADRMHEAIAPFLGATAPRQAVVFSAFAVAGSQLVSNVPFVILAGEWIPKLADPLLLWLATALAATLAGNLTVIGSVANVIVLEVAGSRARIGFWAFLRIGAAVTATTLAAALALLLAERALGLL